MDGKIVIGTEIDTKGFDKEIVVLEDRLNDIKATLKMADEDKTLFSTREIKEMEAEAQKLGRRIDGLREKQAKIDNAGFLNMQKSIESVGKSINGVVKKVVKWGLAVFAVRSAYMGIRMAVNQAIQDDERLKTQIEYIKWSIGQSIKPIVEFIVNLVYKIVAGVGAVIKLLFGINIFSKATADNFNKANSNAKQLKKTLAGFDEMNILNEDGSTGILGGLDSKDLSLEVDTVAKKIKKWWKNWTRMPSKEEWKSAINDMLAPWKAGIDFLKEKVWNPFIDLIMYDVEMLRPIWKPVANEGKRVIDEIIKPKWAELKTFITQKTNQLKPIWEPVKNAFIEKKNEMLKAYAPFINTIIDGINKIGQIFGWHLNYIQIESEDTGDSIEENIGGALNNVEGDARDLSNQQFNVNINTNNINNANNGILDIWNNLKSMVSRTWDIAVNYVTQGGQSLWGNIRSLFGFAKGGVVVPKLASGGIINQPGRGVPIGSAVGGERGMEGVIPLTDSQQMALLGEAIGKYITINANITNTMNGRVISRELQKVQNESNFAYNR